MPVRWLWLTYLIGSRPGIYSRLWHTVIIDLWIFIGIQYCISKSMPMLSILVRHHIHGYIVGNVWNIFPHRNGEVVRVTALLCTGDVKTCLQRFQGIPGLSPWRPPLFCHDDVIKWKHFPRYWPFVREIHRSPVNSPHKVQRRGALMFSLICARINGWVNNREAGDLRRHRAHYDVTIMDVNLGFTLMNYATVHPQLIEAEWRKYAWVN